MDYRTMVNPTYLTAKSTVFMLAIAGNEDAKRMIAGLGLEDSLSRRDPSDTLMSEADAKALMTGVAVAIEARYAALSRKLMLLRSVAALTAIPLNVAPLSLMISAPEDFVF